MAYTPQMGVSFARLDSITLELTGRPLAGGPS